MKQNEFTLKQMFSIVDGRLSTGMDDVYKILSIAAGETLMTTALPIVMTVIARKQPKWYIDALNDLDAIKVKIGNDFDAIMKHLDTVNNTYEVSALNDKTK